MKEVTLKIPDNKVTFFMELVKQLGFEAFVEDAGITEADKELVRDRIRKADKNPSRLLVWDDVQDDFRFD